jgi:hypothetical protein
MTQALYAHMNNKRKKKKTGLSINSFYTKKKKKDWSNGSIGRVLKCKALSSSPNTAKNYLVFLIFVNFGAVQIFCSN